MARVINGRKQKASLFGIIVGILLIAFTVALFAFLLWAVRFSLYKEDFSYASTYYGRKWTPDLFLHDWHFENFANAFSRLSTLRQYKNSGTRIYLYDSYLYGLLYAVGGAVMQTLCTSIVAYLTAKYDNVFSRIFHKAVLFTLILPIAGNIVSQLDLVRKMHIWNSILGTYIQKFGFTNMYYLVFYAAFKRLSWEFAESAFIDGAGHFKVFFRIMFPLSLGLFGTVTLLFFVQLWNDYQYPLMFIPDSATPSVLLFDVMTNYSMERPPLKAVCALLVCLPILIVFLIFRDKVMCNLTEGGIKE